LLSCVAPVAAKSLLLSVVVTVLPAPALALSNVPVVLLTLAPSALTKPVKAKLPAAKVAAVLPSLTLVMLPVSVAFSGARVIDPMVPLALVGSA
jgi:hypothetical protein